MNHHLIKSLGMAFFTMLLMLLIASCGDGGKSVNYSRKDDNNPCVITPQLRKALNGLDVLGGNKSGLLMVCSREPEKNKNGKYYKPQGCIDRNGNMVVPLQYEDVNAYSNSLIIIQNNGKQGLLDSEGNPIVSCQYDNLKVYGNYAIVRNGKKYGIISDKGEIVIPLQYDLINSFYVNYGHIGSEQYKFESVFDLIKDGNNTVINLSRTRDSLVSTHVDTPYDYHLINRNGKFGYINYLGEEIPCQFQNAREYYYEGLAAVVKNNKVGFVDQKGIVRIPFQYDYSEYSFNYYSLMMGVFKEGLAAVMKGGKWGYIDNQGNTVIPFAYDGASCFNQGAAVVWKNQGNKAQCGLIDRNNAVVLPFDFEDGYPSDKVFVMRQQGKVGMYSSKGDCLLPCQYDDIYCNEGYAEVKIDGQKGLVDEDGHWLFPCEYESCSYDRSCGYVWVEKDGKCGYYNLQKQVVVPVKFDHVFPCGDSDLFVVVKDNRRGLYDLCGNCTLD